MKRIAFLITLLTSQYIFAQNPQPLVEQKISEQIFEYTTYNKISELNQFLSERLVQHGATIIQRSVEFPREHIEQEENEKGEIVDVIYYERPIERAVLNNHHQIIEILIRYGADPNGEDPNGIFPLLMASQWNCIESARTLLRLGANVNKQTKAWGGNTPLIHSATLKHADMVQLLLENKANPHLVDLEGNTALHNSTAFWIPTWWAQDNTETIRLLVEAGANLEQENMQGHTPLYVAILNGPLLEIEQMLKLGADPDHESTIGAYNEDKPLQGILTPRQLVKWVAIEKLKTSKSVVNIRKIYSLLEQY